MPSVGTRPTSSRVVVVDLPAQRLGPEARQTERIVRIDAERDEPGCHRDRTIEYLGRPPYRSGPSWLRGFLQLPGMVRTERIGYEALGIALVGYLAVDEPARGESRPGVVLMHEGGGQDGVDLDRIAAAGFCFGGVMALELARSTVPLRAAIGFHPGSPRPDRPTQPRSRRACS